jgi:hypothetical protein
MVMQDRLNAYIKPSKRFTVAQANEW